MKRKHDKRNVSKRYERYQKVTRINTACKRISYNIGQIPLH